MNDDHSERGGVPAPKAWQTPRVVVLDVPTRTLGGSNMKTVESSKSYPQS